MHNVGPCFLCTLILLAPSTFLSVAALSLGPNKRPVGIGENNRPSPPKRRPSREGGSGTERSRAGYSLRADGVRNSGRVKPPKWEREGDDLYAEFIAKGTAVTFEEARETLAKLIPNITESTKMGGRATEPPFQNGVLGDEKVEDTSKNTRLPPMGTMWGSLSVGPVLRSRLVDRAGLEIPTAVQEAAFDVILKGQNAVIASPTGTGKSLSFLVPLLCKFGLRTPSIALILTPTVELALQLQRELDDKLGYGEGNDSLAIQVVGGPPSSTSDYPGDDMLLSSIGTAPFLAGTAKTFRRLLEEAKRSTNSKLLGQAARALLSNPKCIVLDEADRLLQTEQRARYAAATASKQSTPKFGRKAALRPTTTQTEFLLQEFPLGRMQLVCASATVGRTLRKQIMDLVGAPSVDKASVLVTADERTKKDSARRRASWVPSGISHWYRLIQADVSQSSSESSDDKDLDDCIHEATVAEMWDTMQCLQPATSLIFPGRAGVARVQQMLQSRGLKRVRTLRDYVDNGSCETMEQSDVFNWENTTIHIVGEKFGRGLDLPGVYYVFLVAPPSSAAAYAHLAGRTGRNQRPGKTIMLVRPKEACKVVAIAGALGLSFSPVEGASTSDAPTIATNA